MSNIAKALKAEISRISRKEAKSSTEPFAKSNLDLKKTVVDLKNRLAALEKENKRLLAVVKGEKRETPSEPSEETKKARITSTTIRSIRNRFGLTQAEFAKLLGISPYSVHLWETKDGPLNMRDKTKAALLSIKGMGAREAKEKLGNADKKK
jgi:DNA-binding transcriptional regulator YiaG